MDLDYYRSLDTDTLLLRAREEGITPDMAIALAERLEEAHGACEMAHLDYDYDIVMCGGRYQFKTRSIA